MNSPSQLSTSSLCFTCSRLFILRSCFCGTCSRQLFTPLFRGADGHLVFAVLAAAVCGCPFRAHAFPTRTNPLAPRATLKRKINLQLSLKSKRSTVGIDFGRAYFRVRWFLPWLSPRTSIRLPWLRFPKPPCDPGQPVFPGPVQTLAFLRRSSRCQRDLSAGTHASLPSPVYHRTRPFSEQRHSLAQWPAAVCPVDRQVPRAPLPGGDVTSAGAMSCTASKGITLSSLLLRAHAPARLPSAYFGLGLVWRIFAGYCQFLLRVGPSRRYLRETLLGCLDLCHGGIRSALARYFLHIVGLPQRVMGRLPTNFHPMTPWWALFSRLQSFLNVQTSKLACHPGHPYRNGIPVGQPWRLHPGRTCVVASTCTGYAIRPKRAIDGRGLSPHKSHSLVGYSYPPCAMHTLQNRPLQ